MGCDPLLRQHVLSPADVHKLRVSVKELQALWQVLKPFLTKGQAKNATKDIGYAAKLMAGSRDQYVLVKTLDKLIRKANKEDVSVLRQARDLLVAQQTDLSEEILMMEDIVSRFALDYKRWQRLELTCSKRELMRDGFGRLCRKAGKRFRQAAKSENAEDWHRLRRWVKYMALALPAVTDDDDAKRLAKRYADLAKKLGDLHDLDVLAASLHELSEPSIHSAIPLAEHQADKLKKKCYRQSERLFRKQPKGFHS